MRPKPEEWAEILPKSGPSVRFIDAHVHLSDYDPPSRILAGAKANQTVLVSQGVDRESSMRSVTLARSYPGSVRAFVGVHPSEAEKETDLGWFDVALGGAEGAGELGLDPKYSTIERGGPQRIAFDAQLRGAEAAGKPVQVHSRDAEEECLGALSDYTLPGVLMHWFQRDDLAKVVFGRGYFVSFGPALMSSKKLQRIAVEADRSLVLTESDGPVAFGQIGGAGGPSLVPSVVFELSRLWKLGFDETSALLLQNGLKYLGSTGKG